MACNGEAMSAGHDEFLRLLKQLIDDEGGNAPAARRLGVPASTLWKWIAQNRKPTVEHCALVAAALGLHPLEVVAMAYDLELPAFDETVEWDPEMDQDARDHIRNQRRLLVRWRPEEDG